MNSGYVFLVRGNSIGSACSRRAASSTRARTNGSASAVQATAQRGGSSSPASSGSNPGAGPRSIASQSATLAAIGPTWSKLDASGKQPSAETSPYVGLKPTTPQQAAGIRIEPPESVPSAASARPAASAAADPPLEPPAIRPGATG